MQWGLKTGRIWSLREKLHQIYQTFLKIAEVYSYEKLKYRLVIDFRVLNENSASTNGLLWTLLYYASLANKQLPKIIQEEYFWKLEAELYLDRTLKYRLVIDFRVINKTLTSKSRDKS